MTNEELLLTPWQMREASRPFDLISEQHRAIAKDQLAKAEPLIRKDERERIIAWGIEPCPHWADVSEKVIKRDCSLCWQALKEEKDVS